MATIACDVLVIGSGLGGLVAGTYAARAGLRVILVEEDAQAKRPPLLREPFLLARGDAASPVDTLLADLGLSPGERRSFMARAPAVQIGLPEARLDVGGGCEACATEVESFGLAARDAVRSWLETVERTARAARLSLAARERSAGRVALAIRALRGAGRALTLPQAAQALAPSPPGRTPVLLAPLVEALSRSAGADPQRAPALLIASALSEATRGPDAATGLLDLLRRRFTALYGEARSGGTLELLSGRRTAGVDLGRERLMARAVVLAAPASLLGAAHPGRVPPDWLEPAPDAARVSARLFRADRSALSSGMGSHVIDATDPTATRWILRSPDPADERVEWILVRSASIEGGAGGPLGRLAPLAGHRLVEAETGPEPQWDLGGDEVRIRGPGGPVLRRRRPLVLSVGPDVAPSLGAEGELWIARRAGLYLGERLGLRRRLLGG
jgi:hypothetical protein